LADKPDDKRPDPADTPKDAGSAKPDTSADAATVKSDAPDDAAPAKAPLPDANRGQNGDGPTNQRRNRPGNKNARKKAGKPPPPKVVEVAPMATAATMQRRHWGLLVSFVLFVLAPLAVTGWYLWGAATDQYASNLGFTIRQEETGAATELIGGFAAQLSGGNSGDASILYEFIRSQELVATVDTQLDLRGHYSQNWDTDPVFSIWPDASIEDLVWFWGRVVRVAFDEGTGLVEVRVLAFDPDYAQTMAETILRESQARINDLNATARADSLRYAEADLEAALDRLKTSREALTLFRTRTQIVDPESDLQGRMGVVNNLQGQLAQALIDLDLLSEGTIATDPRIAQAERRIEVIRDRVSQERANVASGDADIVGDDYPSLLAEYEGLVVDREFAEETYRAALTALDLARTNANRQSRYLAAYVTPTLPQTAEFPRRFILFGIATLFLVLGWGIVSLIYYSIRDSR